MHKVGNKVITPYGEGILDSMDQTGQHWLVTYPDGFEEFVNVGAIKPHQHTDAIEAVDVNGDHWLVMPPQDGKEFWTLESIDPAVKTQAKPQAKPVKKDEPKKDG